MKLPPAMTMPMAITIINSNNENPRCLLDFIGSFREEEKSFDPLVVPVRDADAARIALTARNNSTDSRCFIASLIIVGSGYYGVKGTKDQYGSVGLLGEEWLPMSSIDNRRVK